MSNAELEKQHRKELVKQLYIQVEDHKYNFSERPWSDTRDISIMKILETITEIIKDL